MPSPATHEPGVLLATLVVVLLAAKLAGGLLGPSALDPLAVVTLSTFIVPVWLHAQYRDERA